MAPSATLVIPCLYNSFSFTSENITTDKIVIYDILSVKSPARDPPSVPVQVQVPVPVPVAAQIQGGARHRTRHLFQECNPLAH